MGLRFSQIHPTMCPGLLFQNEYNMVTDLSSESRIDSIIKLQSDLGLKQSYKIGL